MSKASIFMTSRFPKPTTIPSLFGLICLLIINAVTICGVVLRTMAYDQARGVTTALRMATFTLVYVSALYALMSYYMLTTGKRLHNGFLLGTALVHIISLAVVVAALNDLVLFIGLLPPIVVITSVLLSSMQRTGRPM